MLQKIRTMLASQDEELIKQGIDLIIHLGLEELIESEFKEILDEGEATVLQAGPQLKALFIVDDDSYDDDSYDDDSYDDDDEYYIDEELIQACFFALLKGSGRLGTTVKSLDLTRNDYFFDFDLLTDLEGVESLSLKNFKASEVIEITKCAQDITSVGLWGR